MSNGPVMHLVRTSFLLALLVMSTSSSSSGRCSEAETCFKERAMAKAKELDFDPKGINVEVGRCI